MAVGHYQYDKDTPHGAQLHSALTNIEEGRDNLLRAVACLIQMKDGADLTSYAVEKYGFIDVGKATSALAELESMKGALDGIVATLNQGFNKFRNG